MSHWRILMQAFSSDESSLGPVSCTLGTDLNAKRLTVGSCLTLGLTAHLAPGSTSILISLKLLLYNNAIAMGGRGQGVITVWHNIMPVTHGMMLADSSSIPGSSTLEPELWPTTACCTNTASEQRILRVRRCGKWHFDHDLLFWSEQKNTGNLWYFCHALPVSLVKGNIISIELCSAEAKI